MTSAAAIARRSSACRRALRRCFLQHLGLYSKRTDVGRRPRPRRPPSPAAPAMPATISTCRETASRSMTSAAGTALGNLARACTAIGAVDNRLRRSTRCFACRYAFTTRRDLLRRRRFDRDPRTRVVAARRTSPLAPKRVCPVRSSRSRGFGSDRQSSGACDAVTGETPVHLPPRPKWPVLAVTRHERIVGSVSTLRSLRKSGVPWPARRRPDLRAE